MVMGDTTSLPVLNRRRNDRKLYNIRGRQFRL